MLKGLVRDGNCWPKLFMRVLISQARPVLSNVEINSNSILLKG